MRVGILDIIALPSKSVKKKVNYLAIHKQFASMTPQTIATWCRQLGHETHYATYFGLGDPEKKLPDDLDMVMIACFTQSSSLAYALANYYRKKGITTVIGGSHAKSFPADALRFFDIAVKECDKSLLKRILQNEFPPGSHISATKPYSEVPSVEERMPDILSTAFFFKKHRTFLTSIPMLMSTGCPYDCHFCTEWDKPYNQFSNDRLYEDLKFVSKNFPKVLLQFQDPNFAIKFDEILTAMEKIPPTNRPSYITQSSLTVLKSITRMQRLRDTNCVAIAPGIESWVDYSKKAAVGAKQGQEKVDQVATHLRTLYEFVPYGQANIIFGLDTDMGDEPIELSKEFVNKIPFYWPSVNIPVPFGSTPLFDQQHEEDRVLKNMPFLFYFNPYLVVTLKHYTPVEYYEKLIDLIDHITKPETLKKRMNFADNRKVKVLHWLRTIYARSHVENHKVILRRLKKDTHFREFHEGKNQSLPDFYHVEYDNMLGKYSELLKPADRYADFTQLQPQIVD